MRPARCSWCHGERITVTDGKVDDHKIAENDRNLCPGSGKPPLPPAMTMDEMMIGIAKVREIHSPWGIYTECGHEHTEAELDDEASTVHEIDLVGLVCEEGLMYRVCRSCCVEPGWAEGFQTETCASKHTHTTDGPVCLTTAALDGVEMPDAERWV
jgi:hypothetical protein